MLQDDGALSCLHSFCASMVCLMCVLVRDSVDVFVCV